MNNGIIFWVNSSHSIHVFRQQKRVFELSLGEGIKTSAEIILKIKDITISIAIYILTLFVVNNKDQYKLNSEIQSINTRHNSNLHQPLSKLTTYQKQTHYCGIKIFNYLPSDRKKVSQ
jgi:hypothetical protein